mmetsp:Transcript_21407/g.30178  ORF Transcript_21407/g.30178 Transcript_21407/m.30178 type:complete len:234 (+) Transcript_21407:910-1611(+)
MKVPMVSLWLHVHLDWWLLLWHRGWRELLVWLMLPNTCWCCCDSCCHWKGIWALWRWCAASCPIAASRLTAIMARGVIMLQVVEVLRSQMIAASGGLSGFAYDVVEWRVKSETAVAVLAEPCQHKHSAHVALSCRSLGYQPKWWMGVFAFPPLGCANTLEIVQTNGVGVVTMWNFLLRETVRAVWLTVLGEIVCCRFGVWSWKRHGPRRGCLLGSPTLAVVVAGAAVTISIVA